MKQRHLFESLTRDKVNAEERKIYGSALISIGPAKGHYDKKGRQVYIDATTLAQVYQQAVKLGTVKLKIEHNSGVVSTAGYIENFAMADNKVIGDLCFYESEKETPRILEIADMNPTHIGISLEFDGKDVTFGNQCLARCSQLFAGAIVSDPAANDSLFEEKKDIDIQEQPTIHTPMTPEEQEQMNTLTARFTALEDSIKQLTAQMEADDPEKKEEPAAEPDPEPTTTEPAAEPDPEPTDDDKKEMAALRKTVKALSASIGTLQAKVSAGIKQTTTKKNFGELVEEQTKTFSGDKQKAMIHCLSVYKDEYKAWRPVK